MENVEDKVEDCPFKTERRQCVIIGEKKGSTQSEKNSPCKFSDHIDYKKCIIYLEYKTKEKE